MLFRSVAPPEIKTTDIYRGTIPFIIIQVVVVILILAFPNLISVGKPVDMKEQIELEIEAPSMDRGYQPSFDYSPYGGEEAPQFDVPTQ